MQSKNNIKLDPIEQKKREHFKNVFNEYFKKWSDSQKKRGLSRGRQEDFAYLIHSTRNSVSNWGRGEDYPQPYMIEAIAKEFNVDPAVFYPQITHKDRWNGDSDYMSDFGDLCNEYCASIGLDVHFLEAIISITDFSHNYPAWSPIYLDQTNFFDPREFKRMNIASSAPIKDGLKCFQTEKDGKRITLSFEDLDYLKDLQDTVAEFIEYQYYKRQKEMDQEVQNVENACVSVNDHGMITVKHLSGEAMAQYDKYHKAWFTDEKKVWLERLKELNENGGSKKEK